MVLLDSRRLNFIAWKLDFPTSGGSYYVDENAIYDFVLGVPTGAEICPGLNLAARLSLDGLLL